MRKTQDSVYHLSIEKPTFDSHLPLMMRMLQLIPNNF